MKAGRPKLRRILVALDSAPNSSHSLESGVEVAARLGANLLGLFVEDADILRAAALPLTRQVCLLTGAIEKLDTLGAERQLATTASAARKRLASAATRRKVTWSFSTVRGSVVTELTSAAAEADLLVIHGARTPFEHYLRLRAGAGHERPKGSLLIVPPGTQLRQPVAVCFDGSDDALDALRLAVDLCADADAALEILLCADDDARFGELEEQARREFEGLAGTATFRRVGQPGVTGLRSALKRRAQGCLVMSSSFLPESVDARALAGQLELPILLVG